MAKFALAGSERVETFRTADGEEVRLVLRRLSRIEKVEVIAARSIRLDVAEAERLILRHSVIGWQDVYDEKGTPIPFSFGALDRILGLDDALAVALSDRLFALNGLLEEDGKVRPEDPLDQPRTASSTSTSTAESSPSPPESRSTS